MARWPLSDFRLKKFAIKLCVKHEVNALMYPKHNKEKKKAIFLVYNYTLIKNLDLFFCLNEKKKKNCRSVPSLSYERGFFFLFVKSFLTRNETIKLSLPFDKSRLKILLAQLVRNCTFFF